MYAYARDIRYHNRICRWESEADRADAEDAHYVNINDEEDAFMIALGYHLDDDFAIWQSPDDCMAGIGVGVEIDNANAIDEIIARGPAAEDLFYCFN